MHSLPLDSLAILRDVWGKQCYNYLRFGYCGAGTVWFHVPCMSSGPVFPSACCILIFPCPCVPAILYSSLSNNLFVSVRVVGTFTLKWLCLAFLYVTKAFSFPCVWPVKYFAPLQWPCTYTWELPHHQATVKEVVLGPSTRAQTSPPSPPPWCFSTLPSSPLCHQGSSSQSRITSQVTDMPQRSLLEESNVRVSWIHRLVEGSEGAPAEEGRRRETVL